MMGGSPAPARYTHAIDAWKLANPSTPEAMAPVSAGFEQFKADQEQSAARWAADDIKSATVYEAGRQARQQTLAQIERDRQAAMVQPAPVQPVQPVDATPRRYGSPEEFRRFVTSPQDGRPALAWSETDANEPKRRPLEAEREKLNRELTALRKVGSYASDPTRPLEQRPEGQRRIKRLAELDKQIEDLAPYMQRSGEWSSDSNYRLASAEDVDLALDAFRRVQPDPGHLWNHEKYRTVADVLKAQQDFYADPANRGKELPGHIDAIAAMGNGKVAVRADLARRLLHWSTGEENSPYRRGGTAEQWEQAGAAGRRWPETLVGNDEGERQWWMQRNANERMTPPGQPKRSAYEAWGAWLGRQKASLETAGGSLTEMGGKLVEGLDPDARPPAVREADPGRMGRMADTLQQAGQGLRERGHEDFSMFAPTPEEQQGLMGASMKAADLGAMLLEAAATGPAALPTFAALAAGHAYDRAKQAGAEDSIAMIEAAASGAANYLTLKLLSGIPGNQHAQAANKLMPLAERAARDYVRGNAAGAAMAMASELPATLHGERVNSDTIMSMLAEGLVFGGFESAVGAIRGLPAKMKEMRQRGKFRLEDLPDANQNVSTPPELSKGDLLALNPELREQAMRQATAGVDVPRAERVLGEAERRAQEQVQAPAGPYAAGEPRLTVEARQSEADARIAADNDAMADAGLAPARAQQATPRPGGKPIAEFEGQTGSWTIRINGKYIGWIDSNGPSESAQQAADRWEMQNPPPTGSAAAIDRYQASWGQDGLSRLAAGAATGTGTTQLGRTTAPAAAAPTISVPPAPASVKGQPREGDRVSGTGRDGQPVEGILRRVGDKWAAVKTEAGYRSVSTDTVKLVRRWVDDDAPAGTSVATGGSTEVEPAGSPTLEPGVRSEGAPAKRSYTTIPREWIGQNLYDWGGTSLVGAKGTSLPIRNGRKGRNFGGSWGDQLAPIDKDATSLLEEVRNRTDEVWRVQGKGGGNFVAPKEAIAEARQALAGRGMDPDGEIVATRQAREQRKQQWQTNRAERERKIGGIGDELVRTFVTDSGRYQRGGGMEPADPTRQGTLTEALAWANQQPKDSPAYVLGYVYAKAKADPRGTHYRWVDPATLVDGAEIKIGKETLNVRHDEDTGTIWLEDGVKMAVEPGMKIPAREVNGPKEMAVDEPFLPPDEPAPVQPGVAAKPRMTNIDRSKAILGKIRDAAKKGELPGILSRIKTEEQVKAILLGDYPHPMADGRSLRRVLEKIKGNPKAEELASDIGPIAEGWQRLSRKQVDAVKAAIAINARISGLRLSTPDGLDTYSSDKLAKAGIHDDAAFAEAKAALQRYDPLDAPKFMEEPKSKVQTTFSGVPEILPQTGKQQPLSFETESAYRAPSKSAEDARLATQYAPAAAATGNLFAGEAGGIERRILDHLRDNPSASLRDLARATGVEAGAADKPMSSPLNQALVKLRTAGQIEVRENAVGGNPAFSLKAIPPEAGKGGGAMADRADEMPVQVDDRSQLRSAFYAGPGQRLKMLRGVLYGDGRMAVADADTFLHTDINRYWQKNAKEVSRFFVVQSGESLIAQFPDGTSSVRGHAALERLGFIIDDADFATASPARATAGGGGSFADKADSGDSPARFEAKPATAKAGAASNLFNQPAGETVTFRPVQMPELIKLAKELMGEGPDVNARLRSSRGLFRPQGPGSIEINPETAKDPYQLAKTMAHEIGHLVDYLSDREIGRGNVLARVRSLAPVVTGLGKLKRFLKESFGDGTPTNKELRAELMELSAWWRPGDMTTAYRKSAVELYADSLSVLLNSPGELQARAPRFFQQFVEHLNRKPDVFKAFMDLQDALAGTPANLAAARRQDIREAFTSGEDAMRARAEERQASDASIVARVRQYLYDSARPVTDLTASLVKEKGRTPENLAAQYALDELGYSNNTNHLMLRRMERDVVKPAKAAGVSIDDIGEFLMMHRISTERAEIANPFGHVPETAEAQLADLRKTLGEEKWTALEQSAKRFHDIVFESVEKAVEVGAYGKEQFETKIKPNRDNYAAFSVVEYVEDYVPAGIREQVGTFKAVGNPFTATVLKTISLNRLNELQAAKNTVRDWLRENFPQEIGKAFKIDQHHPHPPKTKPGHDHLTILEDGKPVAYEVDQYVAKMFQRHDIGGLAKIGRALSAWTYLRHPLYITYSLGFQTANVIRDLKRTWVNMGSLNGTSMKQVLKSYWQAKGPAWRRARGIEDAQVEKMLGEKALDMPFSKVLLEGTDDGAYQRMLEQYGLAEPSGRRKFYDATLGKMLRGMETVATFIETVPKVAGFKILERGGVEPRERAYQVRNYVGTPNLRRRGLATDLTNGVLMYTNAMLQGARADAELAMFRPGTRSGWMMRRLVLDAMPKLLMKAGAAGMFGAAVKSMFDNIPSYDLTNYTVIPLGVTGENEEDRKTVYLRIPHDESGRFLSSLLWAGMDVPGGDTWKNLQNVFNYGFGGLPGWSPIINEAHTWSQYLGGANPRDYRGRDIIGRDAFNAGGWDAAKDMFRWQFMQLGVVSEVGRSFVETPAGTKLTATETVFSTIPGLNRLIKISDRGVSESEWEEIALKEGEEARFRLGLPDDVRRVLRERFRLGRLGLEKLDAKGLRRMAAFDEFYGQYLKLTERMKAAKDAGDEKKVEQFRGELAAMAKDTRNLAGSAAPEDQRRLSGLARDKVLRSDSLTPGQQDTTLQRAGIEPTADLEVQRELHALRAKDRKASEAKAMLKDPRRRAEAAEAIKATRLTAAESSRLERLEQLDKYIDRYRKMAEQGKLSPADAEKRIRQLAATAAKRAA